MAAVGRRPAAAAAAAALAAAAWPAACPAQWLDFGQVETSSESTTAVAVRALGPRGAAAPAPLLSASFARWDSGDAASIGYVHRWVVSGDGRHRWLLGAGVGANLFRSRAVGDEHDESALSARVQSELSGPAPGGAYYALAQASTFRGAWFATVQYTPSWQPFVALEASSYHEASYRAVGAGLRIRLGAGNNWFVRFGVTRTDDKSVPYVGVTYNGL